MMNTVKGKMISLILAASVTLGCFAVPTTVMACDFDDGWYYYGWYYDDGDFDDYFTDYLIHKAIREAYEEEHRYVNVTGVCVSSTAVQLPVGGRYQITGYVLPDNANNKGVCYYSTNPAVAVVDGNGVITALNRGVCNIMTRTSEGGYEACTCMTVY